MAESSVIEPARSEAAGVPAAKARRRTAWPLLRWIVAAVIVVAIAGGALLWSRSGKGEAGGKV